MDPEALSLAMSDGKCTPVVLVEKGLIKSASADGLEEEALSGIMNGTEISILVDLGWGAQRPLPGAATSLTIMCASTPNIPPKN